MYTNLLKKLNIPITRTSGKQKVKCPRCGHKEGHARRKDLSVNIDEGWWKCHSPSCNWRGNVLTGEKKGYSKPQKLEYSKDVPIPLADFCNKRGIPLKIAEKLKWTAEGNDIVFNYFRNGERINYKKRIQQGDSKTFRQHSGAEKILYNLDSIWTEVDDEKVVKEKAIWVEGEVDVASVMQCVDNKKYAILSIDQGAGKAGSDLGDKLLCINNSAEDLGEIKEHYFMLDNDAPGQWTQKEIIRRVGPHKCFICQYPKGKGDANDIINDRDLDKKMNIATIKLMVEQAKQVVPEGAVVLGDWEQEEMIKRFEQGWEVGKKSGFDDLDTLWTALRADMTFVYGWPNSGKGTWTKYIAVMYSLVYGWKWALFNGEDGSATKIADKLISIYLGKDIINDKASIKKEEYLEAIEFVKNHFYFVQPPKRTGKPSDVKVTNKWINSIIKYFTLKYGVNCFIKDPWFQIQYEKEGIREDRLLRDELDREMHFCENYDICFYVDHPLNPDRSSASRKIRPAPQATLLRGGPMKWMCTDNLMCVNRMTQGGEEKGVEIIIEKVRHSEQVGKLGKILCWFNKDKQRYRPETSTFDPMLKAVNTYKKKMELAVMEQQFDEDLPF